MTSGRAVVRNCARRFSTTAFNEFGRLRGTRLTMRLRPSSLALICTWLWLPSTSAMWPFPPKRFKGNALLGAGSLGLDTDGRVIALGDFNGDQLCVSLRTSYVLFVFKIGLPASIWFLSGPINERSPSTSGITVRITTLPSHIPRL
jgi:hypothetical protein